MRSRARGYLSELRRATCSEKFHSYFAFPFSPAKFLAAATNISSSIATGPDKAAYPMLKHFPRSGIDFLLHIFKLFLSLHFFRFVWKISSIIPIYKMGKPLDSFTYFQPISLTSWVSKLFEHIILSRLLFFLEYNSFSFPARLVSTMDNLLLIIFCSFLSPLHMGLSNPSVALRQFLLLSTSPKLLTLSGSPPFFMISFRLAFLLALLVGLNLSFLIGALACFFRSLLSSLLRCSARFRF